MTVGDREERLEWDAFVRSHIADVWSHATAEGLSQADAMDVCELVWRNAAQRLPVLVTSADPRTDLLADVTREARRLLRLRSADSANFAGHDAPRQRTIRLDGNESAAGLAAHAAARPTRNSHGR